MRDFLHRLALRADQHRPVPRWSQRRQRTVCAVCGWRVVTVQGEVLHGVWP